jgi:hypothetical protein
MSNADQREKNLKQQDRERKKTDGVENLLLDQKRIPPVSHLRNARSCFAGNRERFSEELQARLACMWDGCRKS